MKPSEFKRVFYWGRKISCLLLFNLWFFINVLRISLFEPQLQDALQEPLFFLAKL
jgi:hypothetical protein